MLRLKTNNKGFTLIELIIAVAIIAVLVGALAPQYLRYVDKTRRVADIDSAREIKNAFDRVVAFRGENTSTEQFVYTGAVYWGKPSKIIDPPKTLNDCVLLELGRNPISRVNEDLWWGVYYYPDTAEVHHIYLIELSEILSGYPKYGYEVYPNTSEFLKGRKSSIETGLNTK